MRLITWNNDEVKVNCFIIPDISAHLAFQNVTMTNILWSNELICMLAVVKPRVKKIPVRVCLWATVIAFSRWDGINHKLFCSALTWIMRKVGQDRWRCAYEYSIEWRKVICLYRQLCVRGDKGLPRWLLQWSSQLELENRQICKSGISKCSR